MVMAYCIYCQTLFYVSQFLPVTWSSDGIIRPMFLYDNFGGILTYFYLFILAYSSTIFISIKTTRQDSDTYGAIFRAFQQYAPITLVITTIASLTYMLSRNFSVLWYNQQYLMLASDEAIVSENPLSDLVGSTASIFGMASALGFALSLASRRPLLTLGFLLPLTIFQIMALAGASRVAALYPFIIVAVSATMLSRWRLTVSAVFACLTLAALAMALVGRGNGEFGISTIPQNFVGIFDNAGASMFASFRNLAQGIYITMGGTIMPPNHSELYKLLSISPLPSSIDGFDLIRRTEEIRIHDFVPMSAVTEVMLFGWGYMLFVGGVLWLGLRLNLVAFKHGHFLIGSATSLWLFLIFVQANAYPLRNTFRQEVIAILILVATLMWAHVKEARQAANRRRTAGALQ